MGNAKCRKQNVPCIPLWEYRGRERSRGTTSIYRDLSKAASECKHTLVDITVEPVWSTQLPFNQRLAERIRRPHIPASHRPQVSGNADFGYYVPLKRLFCILTPFVLDVNSFCKTPNTDSVLLRHGVAVTERVRPPVSQREGDKRTVRLVSSRYRSNPLDETACTESGKHSLCADQPINFSTHRTVPCVISCYFLSIREPSPDCLRTVP